MEPDPEYISESSMECTPPPKDLAPQVGETVQENCCEDKDLLPSDSKVWYL